MIKIDQNQHKHKSLTKDWCPAVLSNKNNNKMSKRGSGGRFREDKIQPSNKYVKRCSTSLVIKKIKCLLKLNVIFLPSN